MTQPTERIIQCTTLGQFGNALFQYAFARAYARKMGARLETPYWVGQRLFDMVRDPLPSCKLPATLWDEVPDEAVNIDLQGYFQNEWALNHYSLADVQSWFHFKRCWREEFPSPMDWYVACHLRRGDYLTRYSHMFCLITKESYWRALAIMNIDPEGENVFWVSDETANSFQCTDDPELQFLPDFMLLKQSNILLRSNSTYSWWAATLNTGAMIASPKVGRLTGWHDVEFVGGNEEPLLIYPRHTRLPLKSHDNSTRSFESA